MKNIPATVAEVGVPRIPKNTTRPVTDWSVKSVEDVLLIGRFLCFSFYRDSAGLLRQFPLMREVFEEAIRTYVPWAELLAGSYRGSETLQANLLSGAAKRRNGKGVEVARKTNAGKRGIVKYPHLGVEVKAGLWKDKISIDGKGLVRSLEVSLYHFVAERFLDKYL